MAVLLYLLKWHLISSYFFIKLFTKQKRQVCFLSRQGDEVSLNYKKVMEALKKERIPYQYLVKKINANINDSLRTQGNYSNTSKFMKSIFTNLKSAWTYYISLFKQMHLIATSKVIITDGYNLPICLLKHKKGTKAIQMWHALGAVKQFGYQVLGNKDGVSPKVAKILKMHHNYDYVLSGVEAMNPYFSMAFNVPKEKVLAIGTPTIDYLLQDDMKVKKAIYTKYPKLKKKINVLYSPTFRNDKRDGFKELIENFDFTKFNLIITFHAKVTDVVNDKRIVKIKKSDFSTYDVLKICDYVITDYSALLLDTLIVKKKILFYVYDYDEYSKENGLNVELLKDYPSITKKNAKDLMAVLNDDYDFKTYNKLCETYRPTVKNSTKKICKLIKECLK